MNTYFLRLAVTIGHTRFTRRVMGVGNEPQDVVDSWLRSRPELVEHHPNVSIIERVQLTADDTVVELP